MKTIFFYIFYQGWKLLSHNIPPRELCCDATCSLSLGNDAFDIYSCWTSVPDALVVCSLFYWAWWVSLSLLLSGSVDFVSKAIYPPRTVVTAWLIKRRMVPDGGTKDVTSFKNGRLRFTHWVNYQNKHLEAIKKRASFSSLYLTNLIRLCFQLSAGTFNR